MAQQAFGELPQAGGRGRLYVYGLLLLRYGWISVLAGYAALSLVAPGGDDGYLTFLRPFQQGAKAPPWVFLITSPANVLDWPLRWTALIIFSTLGALWAQRIVSRGHWWIVLLNHAFFVNIWLGQIEVVPMIGVALSWLVMERKAHPLWFGIGVLCLVTKVQVGTGLILLFAFWIFTEQGMRPMLWAGVVGAAIVGVTLLLYPGWIEAYVYALKSLSPQDQWWNGSIFPYGLLLIPFALIPGPVGKLRRARLVACATCFASPYFTVYHASTAMVFETRSVMGWLSWIDAIPRILFGNTHMGAILPALMMGSDVWNVWKERRTVRKDKKLNL